MKLEQSMANPSMSSQICIYCKRSISLKEFDKDHVMPRSFGKFHNSLTLINAVCKACNHFFSKELELFLARDSLWGLMRYRYGLSAFAKPKWDSIPHARLRLRIDDPSFGEWNGALVDLIPPADSKGINPDIVVLPQAAFYKKGTKDRVFFPLDKLNKQRLSNAKLDLSGCFIIGNSDDDILKVKSAVAKLGISTKQIRELSPISSMPRFGQRIRVSVQTRIDAVILRAIAKIAFNYFAFIYGNQLALSSTFDQIREFIRYGSHQDSGLTTVKQGAFLARSGKNSRKLEGHVILIEWPNNLGMAVTCKVSLFNYLTFIVKLCRSFKLLVQQRLCGHYYDLASKRVKKLNQSI